jgi:hypothetical protein
MSWVEALDSSRIHSVAGLTGDRTALIVTNLGRAPPHDLVAAAGLNGGGLVKTVTQRSRQQACNLLPVHGQAADIFYKQRHEAPLRLGEVAWASSPISSSSACASLSQMRRAQMRGYP